jgi:DNA-binding MarR family transcriptional regulator
MAKLCLFQDNGDNMENEIQILKILNGELTQRDIANRTGMSLGSVNLIIKRLIKKGLVKVERINKKNLRYMLTPEGVIEKAKATYKYLLDTFNYIYELNIKIDNVLSDLQGKGFEGILFLHRNDEIEKILIDKLYKKRVKNIRLTDGDFIDSAYDVQNYAAIVWHPDDINQLSGKGIHIINLMDIV